MKCPICKRKLLSLDDLDGLKKWCSYGHYEFKDMNFSKGFYIRVGYKEIFDLYEHSIRCCRIQNRIIERWALKERKKYNYLKKICKIT